MGDAEDAAPKVQRWPAAGGREALELLGYVDLSVRQRVTKPPEIEPLLNIADRSDIMLISSVSGLLIAARRACKGRLKIRELRIFGHGNPGGFWIGSDWISLSYLFGKNRRDEESARTALYHELAKLKDYLSPENSIVIIDSCEVGQSAGQELPKALSRMWGNVTVRAYVEKQGYEAEDPQQEHGPAVVCKGDDCEFVARLFGMDLPMPNYQPPP